MIPPCLELIRGAVSTKDLVPALMHIAFNEGRVYGYNGKVLVSADAKEFQQLPPMTVPAIPFLSALDNCDEGQVRLSVKDSRVRVTSGTFVASIPTGAIEAFPFATDATKKIALKAPILSLLKVVRPFVSEDASRPWSISIRLHNRRAYATNNVIVCTVDLPAQLPKELSLTLPVFAVDELLRIGQEPVAYSLEPNALTFYLPSLNSSVRCTLLEEAWPDAESVMHDAHDKAKLSPIPNGLLRAVQKIFPLAPDTLQPIVQMGKDAVSVGEGGVQSSSVSGLKGALAEGWYNARSLILTLEHATHADWSKYPRVAFKGEGTLRGVLVGVRR